MEEALIVFIIFGSMFAVVYIFLTTRNKERMALIEKGADAKLFKAGPGKSNIGLIVLNIALMAIGIGIGVLLASLLSQNGMDEEVAFPAMIFIGGGLGLLAGFFASRKFKDDKME